MAGQGGASSAISRANLTPRTSAIKHGVAMAHGLLLPCARCPAREVCPEFAEGEARCGLERQYLEERRKELLSEAHVKAVGSHNYPGT